jgi:hypothetical protein
MSLGIVVRCINCQQENSFDHETLRKAGIVECQKCGQKFNLFGIWSSLYETNPMCERIVDVATKNTDTNYELTSENHYELVQVVEALDLNRFESLKRQIFHDIILYGNSFVSINFTGTSLRLQRLEPKDLSFKVDFVQRPPFISYQEEVVEITENKNSISIDPIDVLHYRVGDLGCEPFGFSILGMWFDYWYFIGDWEGTVPLLNLKNPEAKMLSDFWQYQQTSVILAARIPPELLFPWNTTNSSRFTWDMFQSDIRRRREEFIEVTEEKLFPRILNHEFDESFPKLRFK